MSSFANLGGGFEEETENWKLDNWLGGSGGMLMRCEKKKGRWCWMSSMMMIPTK